MLGGRRSLAMLLQICDLVGFIAFYNIAFWNKNHEITADLWLSHRFYTLIIIIMGMLYLLDTYFIDRFKSRWHLPMRTIFSVLVASLIIGFSFYLFGPELLRGNYNVIERRVLVLALLLFSGYASLTRLIAYDSVVKNSDEIRWLVIAPTDSNRISHFLKSFEQMGSAGEIKILVEDDVLCKNKVDGKWSDLELKLNEPWSGIILAAGWEIPDMMIERLLQARLKGLRIYELDEFYEKMWEKLPVFHLQRGWFAVTSGFALLHEPSAARIKRFCDVVVSISLMVIFAPILLILYLIIRLESSGPGLFCQDRVGIGGKIFTCWKLRTMQIGSENGEKYTGINDRRITQIGKILRKCRLDEFPQLWNVLKGDMSFIGPRAEWTKCVADYEHSIPFYNLRHLVKPGLTGWAQVNYPYGISIDDAREKLEYDLYYIKNQTFMLDMVIILRTVKVVLFWKGSR